MPQSHRVINCEGLISALFSIRDKALLKPTFSPASSLTVGSSHRHETVLGKAHR